MYRPGGLRYLRNALSKDSAGKTTSQPCQLLPDGCFIVITIYQHASFFKNHTNLSLTHLTKRFYKNPILFKLDRMNRIDWILILLNLNHNLGGKDLPFTGRILIRNLTNSNKQTTPDKIIFDINLFYFTLSD